MMPNLWELLPALYRIRDEEFGAAALKLPPGDPRVKGPLRELLELIQSQVELLRDNIGELHDDFFIETCAEWVIPYIGDLIGNKPVYDIAYTRRADVARTIYYRKRKGTHAVTEELANDVTGWEAYVVPFFELLSWTQNLNHTRLQPVAGDPNPLYYERVGSVPVRSLDILDRLGGPFDSVAHTVDIRRMSSAAGWHGPRKVGVFLWRLEAFLLAGIPSRRTANALAHEYHLSPLGNPVRLFRNPLPTTPETLSTEANFPAPIRRVSFAASAAPYVDSRSIRIYRDGGMAPADDLVCMDLSAWQTPPQNKVGVDVLTGRVSFGAGQAPADAASVRADFNLGFPGRIGGGPYPRLAPVYAGEPVEQSAEWRVWNPGEVAGPPFMVGPSETFSKIGDAVDAWKTSGRPPSVIEIADSGAYTEALSLDLAGSRLVVRAADGQRPTLIGGIGIPASSAGGSLALSGLLIAGEIAVEGDPESLALSHCTMVPGGALTEAGEPAGPAASIRASAQATSLRVEIERSITGRLELAETLVHLTIRDSIVDAAGRNPPAMTGSVLLSGNLSPMPALGAPARLRVAVGSKPARAVTLEPVPATLTEARDRLQAAIRDSAPLDPAFQSVRVIVVGKRLAVLSTSGSPVWIHAAETNDAAGQLALLPPDGKRLLAVLGGPIAGFTGFPSPGPAVRMQMGVEAPVEAALGSPTTLPTLRNELQAAIRNAGAGLAFVGALVGLAAQRLLVVPGEEDTAALFLPAADPSAFLHLALESARPAIAGSAGGEHPAPAATLERVTVLGHSYFRELAMANECVFTAPVRCEKRQSGCVRFSYAAPGSETPRRYRCQPDEAAKDLDEAARTLVLARVRPEFTSVRYGEAAYCQLSPGCAREIAQGAEDGGEMGAWHMLLNPHREANLRMRLDEYLPFGLEAGLIFMT